MPVQDIIVLGASWGGLDVYQTILKELPANLPAAAFLVQHVGAGRNGVSVLPSILGKATALPVSHPANGETIKTGRVYVAPPDYHMVLERGFVHLSHGPKENFARPAINPLFRSAAKVYGARVAGVILTGLLDDGVAGLAEIKRQGGITIIQAPETAVAPSMPTQAVKRVGGDYVLRPEDIGALLSELAMTDRTPERRDEAMERTTTDLTCPECRGPIWEERQGQIVEYRCRIGHVYSPLAYLEDQLQTVERSLGSSLVALEELAAFAERIVADIPEARSEIAKRRQQADTIRAMLRTR